MQLAAPPQKLHPAILGGTFMGVLSALPFVSYANACCCLWVMVGGLLAAWLMQQNHPYAITTADGALVGLLAGVFGALIGTVVSLLMSPFQRELDLYMFGRMSQMMGEIPPMLEQVIEQRRSGPAVNIAAVVLGLFFTLIVYPIFSLLGGLLGAALFKKNAPPLPPSGPYTTPVSPADLPPAP
jgi:uncharacterized membrane protein YeaQ/YmgE (transglycosylase-associated protein family)